MRQKYDAAIIRRIIETPTHETQYLFRCGEIATEANYGRMVGVGVSIYETEAAKAKGREGLFGTMSVELAKSDDLTSEMIGIVIRQVLVARWLRDRQQAARDDEEEADT